MQNGRHFPGGSGLAANHRLWLLLMRSGTGRIITRRVWANGITAHCRDPRDLAFAQSSATTRASLTLSVSRQGTAALPRASKDPRTAQWSYGQERRRANAAGRDTLGKFVSGALAKPGRAAGHLFAECRVSLSTPGPTACRDGTLELPHIRLGSAPAPG
jgi:hypothetical protein